MAPFAGQIKKWVYLKNICRNSCFLDAFLATIRFAGTHYCAEIYPRIVVGTVGGTGLNATGFDVSRS